MAAWRRRADVSPLCASSRVRSVIINKRSIIINKFFGDEIQSEIFGVGCCRPLSSAATRITALYNAERGVLSRPRLRASELACAHARHGATGLLKCGLIVRGSRPYRQCARAVGAVGRTRTDLCSPRVDAKLRDGERSARPANPLVRSQPWNCSGADIPVARADAEGTNLHA